jgi:uncharacterized protein YoxC
MNLGQMPQTDENAETQAAKAKRDAQAKAAGYAITLEELDQLTNSFADTYVSRMASVCDQIALKAPTPEMRADAQYLKLISAVSAYDIATEVDPYSQLLDFTTMITLQHLVWVQENAAETRLGSLGKDLATVLTQCREEMTAIAARVLKKDQLDVLIEQASDWRARNPSVRYVALVRFNDAASERARAVLTQVPKGSGLMAPVSMAVDNLAQARKFAERAFFLGKRLPLLIGWQADDTVNRVFTKKEVQETLEMLKHTTATLDTAVGELKSLPAFVTSERQAITAAIDERQKGINETIAKVDATIANASSLVGGVNGLTGSGKELLEQVTQTSKALEQTIAGVDKVLARLEAQGMLGGGNAAAAAPGKSYDLDAYTAAAERMTRVVQELNVLVKSSNDLLASEAWNKRLHEINESASERVNEATKEGKDLTDFIFKRGLMTIAAMLLAAMIYRVFSMVVRRRLPSPAAKPHA